MKLITTNPLISATAILGPLILTACTITTGVYRTIVLDEGFESGSERISVRAPVRRYNSSFFNVELGDYRAANVTIDKKTPVRSSGSDRQPEKRTTIDNTFWNLILKRELNFEKITFDQYRVEEEQTFSYSIAKSTGPAVQTECLTNAVFLENDEVSRTEIGFLKDYDAGSVEYYGEWLASRMSCSFTNADQSWNLEVYKSANGKPELSLERQQAPLEISVAAESSASGPGLAGRAPAYSEDLVIDDKFAGITVAEMNDPLMAVSLMGGNTTIWLDSNLSDSDREMLVATGFSLILGTWINE